jgi:tRNA(fMet)-specific endonuclease VapC
MGGRAFRTAIRSTRGGSALARLILDTTILVSAERSRGRFDALIGDEDDIAIAAITAAELLVGVELADRRRRAARSAYVEAILRAIPIDDYDLGAARAHAALLAETRRAGRLRGAHDLIIAATAISTNRVVVTADPSGFRDLPGLAIRVSD